MSNVERSNVLDRYFSSKKKKKKKKDQVTKFSTGSLEVFSIDI